MNFSDIFKSSFIESVSAVSIGEMVLTIMLSFLVGLFIAWVYKKTYKGVMYQQGFATTLIALTMITSTVILAVTSSVVLSLGMVGALSIVRFRTAVKEPLDLTFLFWSIGAGIILAAGLIPLAVISSAIIGIILIAFVNKRSCTYPYMVVLSLENSEAEESAMEVLRENVTKCVVKSKTAAKDCLEINAEVRLKDDNTDFINAIAEMVGVKNAAAVSYNGDYMG